MIGILEYVIARVAGGDKRSKEKPRRPQRGQVILGRQLTRLTEASRCWAYRDGEPGAILAAIDVSTPANSQLREAGP